MLVRGRARAADALADEGTDAAGQFQFAKALHSLTGIAAQYSLLDKRRQQLLGKERIPLRATVHERNKFVRCSPEPRADERGSASR